MFSLLESSEDEEKLVWRRNQLSVYTDPMSGKGEPEVKRKVERWRTSSPLGGHFTDDITIIKVVVFTRMFGK